MTKQDYLYLPEKIKGNVTIGIGFNMDADGAKEIWDNIFNGEVDYNTAKEGRIKLTKDQITTLFNHTIYSHEEEVGKLYGNIHDNLRLNERLTIVDAYFNYPKLVNKETNFYKHTHAYHTTGDKRFLDAALNEIKNRSNPDKNNGIQNRRNKQAEMLDSSKSPFYSSPFDERLPYKPIKAKLADTVIPKGIESWPKDSDSRFYIWRTQCDEKVRPSHFALEEKIFAKGNGPVETMPGIEPFCRCTAEELPDNIEISDQGGIKNYHTKLNLDSHIFAIDLYKIWESSRAKTSL